MASRKDLTHSHWAGARALREVAEQLGPKLIPEACPATGFTRQARHARLLRARATIAAQVVLRAASDEAIRNILRSDDFALLRPLSAETHRKAVYVVEELALTDPHPFEKLFEWALGWLVDAARTIHTTPARALSVHSAFAALYIGPVLFGDVFAMHVREAWRCARKKRLLDSPHFRMQLAVMSSYAGEPGRLVDWLMDESAQSHEMADVYCFVRRDVRADLYDSVVQLIRAENVHPYDCLYPVKPSSTVRHLMDYALTCLRDRRHLQNEGHLLMVLTWVSHISRYTDELRQRRSDSSDGAALVTRLDRFQKVCRMEKARLNRILEGVPPGAVKKRLETLLCECRSPSSARE